jgi:hypothetical protein
MRDVPKIPHNGTHQDIVLEAEVVVGHRLDEADRPLSRFAKQLADSLDYRIGLMDAASRREGFCHH